MSKHRLRVLLSELKAGKKEYFDEFYSLTKGAVWHAVRKIVCRRFDAEDVVQEAYLSFLTNIAAVQEDPLQYLVQTAKNKALDHVKRERRTDKSVEIESVREQSFDEFPSHGSLLGVCKRVLNEEEFYILEQAVVFGYTRVEIARATGKPVSTVNRKYNEVLKKLKKIGREAY